MKNLKKALVLVLTFAMIFGMFTIGASAASFSDDEDIVNKEAVETMVQLGIINGYEDGTFLPKQVVTRAEMCKMICVALNGGTAPLLDAGVTVFSDTKGHWASAYINYCYAEGIVSGDSGKGGTFRPEAPVTALEAAKMMLVALGYNAQIAGFTGADWAQNVAKEANRKGLFDGIGALNANAPLTRDNAAQLIFNGINADLVDYDNTLVTVDGQLTTVPKIKDLTGKTIITESYKAIKVEGVVVNNEFLGGNKGETTLKVTNEADFNLDENDEATFKVSTGAAELGKTVVLYVKPATGSNAKVASKATVYGKAGISDINYVFATNKAIDEDDVVDTLKAEGLKVGTATLYLNYKYSGTTNDNDDNDIDIEHYANRLGVEAQYIDNNGDGVVDVIIKLTYAYGIVEEVSTEGDGTLVVTELGSANIELNTDKAKTEVVDFAKLGLEEEDYVKYYRVGDDGKFYVEKITGTTVEVTAVKSTKVTASGKTYEVSSLAAADILDGINPGDRAVFFFDNAGALVYVDEVKTAKTAPKYLMLLAVSEDYGTWKDTLTAKVVYDDGTTATVTISKITATDVADEEEELDTIVDKGDYLRARTINAEGAEGAKIFSYKVDDDGKYELTTVSGVTFKKDADADIVKGKPAVASGIVADSKTVFVIGDSTSETFKVYNGIKAVPSQNNAKVFAIIEDGIAKVIFTYGGVDAAAETSDFIYVLDSTPSKVKDGKTIVYSYDVIRNGELTTVLTAIEEDPSNDVIQDTGLFKATFTGNKVTGVIEDDQRIVVGEVDVAKNGVIGVVIGDDSEYYAYDDATVVFVVKGGKATASSVGNIKAGDNVSVLLDKEYTTALYVFVERS